MSLCSGAIWSPSAPQARDLIRAAIATALLPGAAGILVLLLVPTSCDLRGDPAIYRWSCLLPGLMIPVSAALAFLLPLAILLNRRLGRPIPDGWFAMIVIAAVASQTSFTLGYSLALEPAYRRLFLDEIVALPQPFLSGAVAAAVFTAALGWRPDKT